MAALSDLVVLVGGERGVIYRTDDAGTRWTVTRTGLDGEVLDFSFVDETRGWALTRSGGVARTDDGGRTWTPQLPATTAGVHAHILALPDGRVFLPLQTTSIFPALLVSHDGGWTWDVKVIGDHTVNAGLFDVAFDAAGERGVAVGATYDQRGYVAITRDGGETWHVVSTEGPTGLQAVDWVRDSRVVTVGRSGIAYTSMDAGATWAARNTGVPEHLLDVVVEADGHGFATGRAGTVVSTLDGGYTWLPASPPNRDPIFGAALAPNEALWIVQEAGRVLVREPSLSPLVLIERVPSPGLAHAPILIAGDTGFQGPLSGVSRGSGTADDPYVIEGWHFTAVAADAITLLNTSAHLVIRDNTFEQGLEPHIGIRLSGASNVRIEDNTFRDNHAAVAGNACAGVTLRGNLFEYHGAGAAEFSACDNLLVTGNAFAHNHEHGVVFTSGNAIHVRENTFFATTGSAVGAHAQSTHLLRDLNVSGNLFSENRVGVNATRVSHLALWGNGFTFSELAGALLVAVPEPVVVANAFTANEQVGLEVRQVDGARVVENSFSGQHTHVLTKQSREGTYEGNMFAGGYYSFWLREGSSSNVLRDNVIRGAYGGGVLHINCDANVFAGNTVEDTHDFFTTFGNRDNRFENNTFRNSTWGLWVSQANNTIVRNNTFENSWDGPSDRSSWNTLIENNTVRGTLMGIWVSGTRTIVRNNTVEDAEWSGITVGTQIERGFGAVVLDNIVRRAAVAGIQVRDQDGVRVSGNLVTESAAGFQAHSNDWWGLRDLRVEDNTFTGNDVGIHVDHGKVGVENATFWNNTITGNVVGMNVTIGRGPHAPVDARWNWWGATDGPAGIGSGSGDELRVEGEVVVVYDPWLTAPPE